MAVMVVICNIVGILYLLWLSLFRWAIMNAGRS